MKARGDEYDDYLPPEIRLGAQGLQPTPGEEWPQLGTGTEQEDMGPVPAKEPLAYEDVPDFDTAFGGKTLDTPPQAQEQTPSSTDALARARRSDSKAQKSDDVRNLLYAAFARKTPQLRNLGGPAVALAKEQEAMALRKLASQPKPVDPLDSEKKRAEIEALRALVGQREKSEDPRLLEARIRRDNELADMYGRANQPKPEKPGDPLLEEKRRKLEAEIERLKRQPAAKSDKATAKTESARKGATIYYGNEELYVPDDREPPNDTAANALKTRAANGKAINDSTEELERLFAKLDPKNPKDPVRAEIQALQAVLMPAINVYLGQGAMAEAEENRMRQAVGDPRGLATMIERVMNGEEAPANVKARLAATRRFFDSTTRTFASTYGYKSRKGGEAAAPKKQYRVNENGKWEEVD